MDEKTIMLLDGVCEIYKCNCGKWELRFTVHGFESEEQTMEHAELMAKAGVAEVIEVNPDTQSVH